MHPPRLLAAPLLALALGLTAAGAAHAAAPAAVRASAADISPVSYPPPSAAGRAAAPSAAAQAQAQAQARAAAPRAGGATYGGSLNPNALWSSAWSGYAASGTEYAYNQASASFTVPTVTCTTDGLLGIWVGLDGYAGSDDTVEQTGIGVNCASGTPVYTAWYENYPASAVDYSVTVEPGDNISAAVSYMSSAKYSMQLIDSTRGWSENLIDETPQTDQDASAEVIVEQAENGTGGQLPDYGQVSFTGAKLSNVVPQSDGAVPLYIAGSNENWVTGDNLPVSDPQTLDGSGDFQVDYCGGLGSSVVASFQATDGNLGIYNSGGVGQEQLGMMAGTSPTTTQVGSGYWTAFQANSTVLWDDSSSNLNDGYNLDEGLMAGTSPAAADTSDRGLVIMFQKPDGYMYAANTTVINTEEGMMAGTSPAIVAAVGGGYWAAFQANTGQLYDYSSASGPYNLEVPMLKGTSPSIVNLSNGTLEIAVQGSDGHLVLWNSSTGSTDTGLGMAAGTSPAIAALSSGGYEVAFQANTDHLYTYVPGAATDTGQAMDPATSPSVAALSGVHGYEVAYQAIDGDFCVTGAAGTVDTLEVMKAGTSPSITG